MLSNLGFYGCFRNIVPFWIDLRPTCIVLILVWSFEVSQTRDCVDMFASARSVNWVCLVLCWDELGRRRSPSPKGDSKQVISVALDQRVLFVSDTALSETGRGASHRLRRHSSTGKNGRVGD